MNALTILLIASAILVVGYIFYGGWLAKQWGVDDSNVTPAHALEDGVDYVPAKPYVVIGHHFSSIAGAGPINGPIQAAIFGWVPVLLWVLIGGIFFGAMHDFGALFASLRNKGQTLAAVIEKNIDPLAKKLFCIFSFLTLVLVVAAFASIVAGTFNAFSVDATTGQTTVNVANTRTAMISVLFIFAAVIWGLVVRGREIPTIANVLGAIAVIVVIVFIGYNFPVIELGTNTWMLIIGVYILIASVAPVWILLQPRDYLSSYLLYGVIVLAVIGIVGATIFGNTSFAEVPAFTAFDTTTLFADAKVFGGRGLLFPALFITIACGAISGFHSLVASGTTSKQLDHERDAQPIAYGGMLLECLLAVISLCAVAYVWSAVTSGEYATPTQVFAGGLSAMIGVIPGLGAIGGHAGSIAYSLLILAVSAFCLTSLDTATRICRMMFQEMFLSGDETPETVTGWKKVVCNPFVATIISVGLGVGLGMTGYAYIWPLFGAANQLLAALALLAVCSFLGNIGRNNKMFYFPMAFMLVVTLTSLALTVKAKLAIVTVPAALAKVVAAGTPVWAPYAQLILAVVLFVLAIILAVRACMHIFGKEGAKNQAAA